MGCQPASCMTHCQLWKYRLLPGEPVRSLGQRWCPQAELKTNTGQLGAQLERHGGGPIPCHRLVFLLVVSDPTDKDTAMFYTGWNYKVSFPLESTWAIAQMHILFNKNILYNLNMGDGKAKWGHYCHFSCVSYNWTPRTFFCTWIMEVCFQGSGKGLKDLDPAPRPAADFLQCFSHLPPCTSIFHFCKKRDQ